MQGFNFFVNWDLSFLGASIAAIAFLGFTVFSRNHGSTTNRTFFIFSLIAIFWNVLNYLFYQVSNPEIAFWIIRLVIFFAVWYCFFLFRLFYVFPKEKSEFPAWYKYLLTPIAVLTSFITLTPLVFQKIGAVSTEGQIVTIVNGPAIPLFGMVVGSLIIASLIVMLQKLIKAPDKTQKYQTVFILTGTTITFFSYLIFNFILPTFFNNSGFIRFSAIFTFPFIALTAYAIIKHQLFNIRVIATEIFTFLIILVFLINTLTSPTLQGLVINGAFLILVIIFSALLIRGTLHEIKELQRISDLKSEFISIASHQLRTPLTAIKGYLSLVIDGDYGKIDETTAGVLKKVYASNEVLVALVEDLLDVSRIERGEFRYVFQKICIPDMIDNIINEQRISAEGRGLQLIWRRPEKLERFCVRADETKLRQAILNLIDNAIKYTPRGSVEVNVAQLYNNPLRMRIAVKDTGIGVSEADKQKLFQRFSRGEGGKKIDVNGSGLGLFIVKRIVEDHGGSVWVESEGEGRGSNFVISLPFYKSEE